MKNFVNTGTFTPLESNDPRFTPPNRTALLEETAHFSIPLRRLRVRVFAYRRSFIRLSRRGREFRLGIHPDLLQAPEEVLRSSLRLIFSRILRQPPNPLDEDRVSNFSRELQLGPPVSFRRHITSLLAPAGQHHDLQHLFQRVNDELLDGAVAVARLGWSRRPARRKMAWYLMDEDCIVVSRWLDDPRIPEYFLEFVLYHEMLHVLFPARRRGRRLMYHHREFRTMERAFPRYEEVRRFEERLPRLLGGPTARRRGRA
ncbi:MAG: hypothetical protein JXQ27_05795 [Acidobacteria bacterium]|nr:hypothetical protein [Acidobacteriota bacterium]